MTREEAIGQLKFMLEQIPKEPPSECDHIEDIEEWFDTDRKIRSAFKTAIKALDQESVLDKIRAEIEALIEWHDCPIEYDNGNDAWYREACNQAIKIIDKYKAESEGKE